MTTYAVCALYRFVRLDDYEQLREPLYQFLLDNGIRGTLLLAREGINGTVAGSHEAIAALKARLAEDPRFDGIDYKDSETDIQPFNRTKVKLKREIVTMGMDGIDPKQSAGTYVKPHEWNQLLQDPEVTVIDTRNEYEVEVGTFQNAINPGTEAFRQFPEYAEKNLDPQKHRKIAMFCTGGIRCEKSTAYLKEQGFEEVYHLEGGILRYFEEMPEEQSLWNGECFVFDERVAVNQNLERGQYDQCHACRRPITEDDKQSPKYQQGISCPKCYDSLTEEQMARFAERERQIRLAKERGEAHVGAEAAEVIEQRRQAKRARDEAGEGSS
ncbi:MULTISPECIES: rhodanese-related sulfurtransferase [Halomonadaceae]|uniref:tRNA uridine(34) hydroxylase n=1 Tax=Vreelandella halophila TaxID=86177 RepID=A0A9X4YHT6_9GAMM|nr:MULTISPECIES: rhodanese-related sulfurtransferase [Halomonas]MYL28175.1 rhodanese-related sulfurtransferase [Halomonas utahensis]MYL76154.1 rhodanese-related sulfurtransferase [Halomonas sp. 22501_18_FS]